MKILLINPPPLSKGKFVKEGRCQSRAGGELWPPVTLAIMAQGLRGRGYDIKLIDGQAEPMDLKDIKILSETERYDAAIVNSTTVTFFDDIETAKAIKNGCKRTVIILYGTHVTALPEDALKYDEVDIVLRQDPEFSAMEVIESLKEKKQQASIKGISYKDGEKICNNENTDLSRDLDDLPYPALDLLDNEAYRLPKTGNRFTIIRTSRGCPFMCTFCTSRLYYGNKWRTRSVDNVIGEIERDIKEYGIKDYLFNSETFNFNKQWVMEFCQKLITKGIGIRWMCNTRVDTLDDEMLGMMKKAGCWLLSIGIESGDERILKTVKKGINLQKAEEAVKLTKKHGLQTIAYFILGLPGENKESLKNTINFAKKLNATYVRFFKAVPFPGTEFRTFAEKEGWIKSNDWAKYDQADCAVYELPEINNKMLLSSIRKAYISFYLRPSFIYQQIKGLSPKEIALTTKSGLLFLKEWAWKRH